MERPKSLGPRGAAFWDEITAGFDMSPAERELLTEACRTLDTLDTLADGSRMAEARQQRLVLHRLLAAIQLPVDAGVESAATMRGRRAARTRWEADADVRAIRKMR